MIIKLYKDRTIEKEGEVGTQNENNVTDIEIVVPKIYEDYNKKIVFAEHEDDKCKKDDNKEKIIAWDFIEDNQYKIKKNISKYESVDCYIWLTKGDEDFRSETTHLTFNRNQDANEALTEKEIDGFNKMIITLESKIKKVSDLEKDVKKLIDDIQNKLENGEFKGDKGDTPQKGIDYFTSEEKEEFKSAVVEESKNEIKTTVIADSKTELNSHIEDKKTELNNYTTEQEKSLKTEFDDYTDTKKTELDTKKTNLETEMSNTKNSLVQEFNTNATEKTNAFNQNYTEKINELNGAGGGILEPRVVALEDDVVNYISELKVEGESVQAEEPDFANNKEVPLQIIKDNITINVSNGNDTKSFMFPLQKPLIGNFDFNDLEKDVLDLLNEKEVHHWNYGNEVASELPWKIANFPANNTYNAYLQHYFMYISTLTKGVSNLFFSTSGYGSYNLYFGSGNWLQIYLSRAFGYTTDFTSVEALAKWKEMLADKNLELAYYMYNKTEHYIETLQFTEQQKQIARQIKDLIMYEGYTNISVNHELNPTMTLNYAKSNKQAIMNIDKKLDEVINLLSTSTTSAMLIDNMQTDLEKEVL